MNEEFDFSGMSDTDYTDTFADIDQTAEEIAEFERTFAAPRPGTVRRRQ